MWFTKRYCPDLCKFDCITLRDCTILLIENYLITENDYVDWVLAYKQDLSHQIKKHYL